jgi:hypothetical protein
MASAIFRHLHGTTWLACIWRDMCLAAISFLDSTFTIARDQVVVVQSYRRTRLDDDEPSRPNLRVHSHSALRSDQASTPHVVSVPLVTFERHRVPCCFSGKVLRRQSEGTQHARYEHDLQAYLFHSSFHLSLGFPEKFVRYNNPFEFVVSIFGG